METEFHQPILDSNLGAKDNSFDFEATERENSRFDVERVSDLPDAGGEFTLPTGTKIYKSGDIVARVINEPTGVTITPISADLRRARFVKSEILTSDQVSALPANMCIEDIRNVFIGGKNVGVIYGTEVRKAPEVLDLKIDNIN